MENPPSGSLTARSVEPAAPREKVNALELVRLAPFSLRNVQFVFLVPILLPEIFALSRTNARAGQFGANVVFDLEARLRRTSKKKPSLFRPFLPVVQ
jgi:hypothetical protein